MEQVTFTTQDFQLMLESLIEHQHKLYDRSYLCRDGERRENIKITLDTYVHILDNDAEDAISKVFT
jgi:hypothetical protein